MAEPFFITVLDDRLAAIRAKVEAFDWSLSRTREAGSQASASPISSGSSTIG